MCTIFPIEKTYAEGLYKLESYSDPSVILEPKYNPLNTYY